MNTFVGSRLLGRKRVTALLLSTLVTACTLQCSALERRQQSIGPSEIVTTPEIDTLVLQLGASVEEYLAKNTHILKNAMVPGNFCSRLLVHLKNNYHVLMSLYSFAGLHCIGKLARGVAGQRLEKIDPCVAMSGTSKRGSHQKIRKRLFNMYHLGSLARLPESVRAEYLEEEVTELYFNLVTFFTGTQVESSEMAYDLLHQLAPDSDALEKLQLRKSALYYLIMFHQMLNYTEVPNSFVLTQAALLFTHACLDVWAHTLDPAAFNLKDYDNSALGKPSTSPATSARKSDTSKQPSPMKAHLVSSTLCGHQQDSEVSPRTRKLAHPKGSLDDSLQHKSRKRQGSNGHSSPRSAEHPS